MATKAEETAVTPAQRAAGEHASRVEAAASVVQAEASTRAASLAATEAAGLPGLNHADRRELVAALRGGSSWADAVSALFSGRAPALVPSAATLAAWKPELEAEAVGGA